MSTETEKRVVWIVASGPSETDAVFLTFDDAHEEACNRVDVMMDDDTSPEFTLSVRSEEWSRSDFDDAEMPWPEAPNDAKLYNSPEQTS